MLARILGLALPGEHEEGMGGGRGLVAILVLSALLKLALLVPAHHTYPVGDARDYLRGAHQLREGDYISIRPPLWPATLRLAIGLAETTGGAEAVTRVPEILPGQRRPPRPPLSDLDLARILQVAMSTLSVWLVFLLARELFDRRAGLAAAGLFAFDPGFVGYTHLLWAETLFALLNVGWALLLLRGVRSGTLAPVCAAGVLLGLAALTRQLILNFAVLAVLWIFAMRPRASAVRLAAAFGLFACLAVLPWTLRNAAFHGRFLPVAPTGGWALLHGVTYDVDGEMRRAGLLDALQQPQPIAPIDTERLARARAFEIIVEDPGAYLARTVSVNLPDLWRLGSRVLEYAQRGGGAGDRRQHGYGAVPGWLGLGLVVVFCAVYLLGMGAGLVGMAFAPRWRETLLTGGLLLHACALHAIVGANLRHRLYVMPFVLLYAGFALSRRPSEWRGFATRRRVAVAAGLLGAFLLALAAADHREVREQWVHFRALAGSEG